MSHFRKTVRMISLGCPKNLVDSEVMLGLLKEKGWVPSAREEADLVVINTCGFIREAKEESIETILAAAAGKERGKCGKLVVTGCLPQRYGGELVKELPEVDLFLGTGEFHRIADLLAELPGEKFSGKKFITSNPRYLYDHRTPRLWTSSPGSVYVKVSEGCSNHCSYCVIPGIRGKLRSRAVSSVVQEVEQAVSRGVKEINLLAQDITAYGKDLGSGASLARLLESLVNVKGLNWIRLLYAHPAHLTREVVALVRGEEKICKYLDLPLQHVDLWILRAMNRPPLEEGGRRLLESIRREIPGITLRTSLMVGFPGETERRFRTLLEFVREAEFDHLGVFRYSKEEGTAAASLKGHVSEKVKLERYAELMRLQKRISLRKNKARIGSRLPVLVENAGKSAGILWEGRTPGQAPEVDGMTFLTKGRARRGEIATALITGATWYDLFGELPGPP